MLRVLHASAAPLSAADVIVRLGSRGRDRATIHRNLVDFARVGLVKRTDLGDHLWRYAVVDRQASQPQFVCTVCGRVAAVPDVVLSIGRAKVPRAVRAGKIAIHFRGVCDSCL